MGSTLQRYNQARKKQDNSKQRAQAKKVISQTPAGVSNFAGDARKIETCTSIMLLSAILGA